MKTVLAAAIMSLAFAGFAAPDASAKGCIKGAIVGGVAGHLAGHGVAGAAAGCAVGHHYANKKAATPASSQTGTDGTDATTTH